MRRERIEVDGQVVFPVFVHEFDDNSMMQFDKVEALHHLEAIDVQNGEYEAWDAQGRVLRLTASDITTLKSGRIRVEATDNLADAAFMTKLREVVRGR